MSFPPSPNGPAPANRADPQRRGGSPALRLSQEDRRRIANVCDDFEQACARRGWDKDPTLALIVRNADDTMDFRRLGIPRDIWIAAGHPAKVVEQTAYGINSVPGVRQDIVTMLRGRQPVGAMVNFEAWDVPQDEASMHMSANLFPERRRDEVNAVVAFDIDGNDYGVERRRKARTRNLYNTSAEDRNAALAAATGIAAAVFARHGGQPGPLAQHLLQLAMNLATL